MTSSSTRWALGGALWLALSGCYRDQDKFHDDAAKYICEYNDNANVDDLFVDPARPIEGGELVQRFEPYGGPNCEEDVVANFEACSAKCEYKPARARRCVRKLRRAARRGNYDDLLRDPCNKAYDCPDDAFTGPTPCRVAFNCAVDPNAPAPAWLLLILIAAARRRRRVRGHAVTEPAA